LFGTPLEEEKVVISQSLESNKGKSNEEMDTFLSVKGKKKERISLSTPRSRRERECFEKYYKNKGKRKKKGKESSTPL